MSGKWETTRLNGTVALRPDERGKFDELVVYEGDECRVHAEMMDDGLLWIGFYPKGAPKGQRFVMTVAARGKLKITAEAE